MAHQDLTGKVWQHVTHVKRIIMVKGYSYVVARDYGFAPNPFWGVLTLATCKPKIRKNANVGDYVIGHSTASDGNKLIFIMKVGRIISFDEYWNSVEFEIKKPVMNGSLIRKYGDNIYHHNDEGEWIQEDSHHSLENGIVNKDNLNRDTSATDNVLIANDFIYLGNSRIDFPEEFKDLICTHIGHKVVDEKNAKALWDYLVDLYPEMGLIDDPMLFREFQRYDGKS